MDNAPVNFLRWLSVRILIHHIMGYLLIISQASQSQMCP